jgi:DNA-binding FadR family transcriptional regulator
METKRRLNPGLNFSLDVLKAHRKILQSVAEKDGDSAEKYMRLHIEEVKKGLENL